MPKGRIAHLADLLYFLFGQITLLSSFGNLYRKFVLGSVYQFIRKLQQILSADLQFDATRSILKDRH